MATGDRHGTDRRAIFVALIGQYDNIGDVILRRVLVDWLDGAGTLHVYVGPSPSSFNTALGLRPHHRIYRSMGAWLWAMARTPSRRRPHFFFKPGEIQVNWASLYEHLGMLPGVLAVKLRGGGVHRVGAGSRNFHAAPMVMFRPSVALSDTTFWRDPLTAARVGQGEVMPDLAFAAGRPVAELSRTDDRRVMVVSLRSDVLFPRRQWCAGVARAAAQLGLRVVVVAQVQRDADRARALAAALGAEAFGWHDDDLTQERALRRLYADTLVTVSDRLHVLIAAFTEGATPVAAIDHPSDKIGRHFDAAGIDGVVVDVAGRDADGIADVIVAAVDRRTHMLDRLAAARADIDRVRDHVLAQLTG